MMQDFDDFIHGYIGLLEDGRNIPLGEYPPVEWPHAVNPEKATVAVFSPHPDDEILAASPLALRFREVGCRVVNIAMTLGRPAQRARRRKELEGACAHIGFELVLLAETGFDTVKATMLARPEWDAQVIAIAGFLQSVQPRFIIVHHTRDQHPDHEGTAFLVRSAIARAEWNGLFFEAEYWHEMESPNFMVEVSPYHLGIMLKALSFHKGELERNPYHLRWLARLSDNVRRSEIVLGWGAKAPEFHFAALYRHNECTDGRIVCTAPGSCVLAKDSPLPWNLANTEQRSIDR